MISSGTSHGRDISNAHSSPIRRILLRGLVLGFGVAGYQAGEDYVFALPATTLADLSAHPDFFI